MSSSDSFSLVDGDGFEVQIHRGSMEVLRSTGKKLYVKILHEGKPLLAVAGDTAHKIQQLFDAIDHTDIPANVICAVQRLMHSYGIEIDFDAGISTYERNYETNCN